MSLVDPLSLHELPLVTSMGWKSARLPWSWAGRLDRPIVLGLVRAGVIRLRWDGFESGELPSHEELSLSDGEGRRGRVLIDRWLALNVVAATLGFGAPRALRRLGPGERGILAGNVAALLTFAGGRVVVDLAASAARAPEVAGAVGLAFHAEAAGSAGPVRLEVPPAWLLAASWPDAEEAAIARVAPRLETTARILIADTVLSAAAFAGAGRGDVVVFEGEEHPRADDAQIPVRVQIGGHVGDGALRPDGAIVFAGPFRPAHRPGDAVSAGVSGDGVVVKDASNMAAGSDDPKLDVLAGAPVEVVAELGRVTLRGDEVLGLERGSVLAFGQRGGARVVDLVVAGRAWARGELVNVDGELGVRITEMVRI